MTFNERDELHHDANNTSHIRKNLLIKYEIIVKKLVKREDLCVIYVI